MLMSHLGSLRFLKKFLELPIVMYILVCIAWFGNSLLILFLDVVRLSSLLVEKHLSMFELFLVWECDNGMRWDCYGSLGFLKVALHVWIWVCRKGNNDHIEISHFI